MKKKMSHNEIVIRAMLGGITFCILSGCGGNKGNTDGIIIGVTPSSSYILPGPHSNCADVAAYKAGLLNQNSVGDLVGTSVSPLRISFPRFTVEWSQASLTLFVAYIKVTIHSSQISPSQFVYEVVGTELDGLMGRSQASGYKGKNDMMSSVGGGTTQIFGRVDSDDPARDCDYSPSSGPLAVYPPPNHSCLINKNPQATGGGTGNGTVNGNPFQPIYSASYGECGLDIGGINLAIGGSGGGSGGSGTGSTPLPQAPSFGATAQIELVGYSEDSSYNQAPVQATTAVQINYVSGN